MEILLPSVGSFSYVYLSLLGGLPLQARHTLTIYITTLMNTHLHASLDIQCIVTAI